MQFKKKFIAVAVLGSVAMASSAYAEVKVGGHVEAWRLSGSYDKQETTYNTYTAGSSPSRFNITGETEEVGSLKMGAVVEYSLGGGAGAISDGSSDSPKLRHAYSYIKGAFGTVKFGQTAPASDGAGSVNLSGSFHGSGTGSDLSPYGSYSNLSGASRASGIHYVSPSFAGLEIKLSADTAAQTKDSSGDETSSGATSFALFYGADFGMAAVKLGVGQSTYAVDKTIADSNNASHMSFSVKAKAGSADITLNFASNSQTTKNTATPAVEAKYTFSGVGFYVGMSDFIVGFSSDSPKLEVDGVEQKGSTKDATTISVQYALGKKSKVMLVQTSVKDKTDNAKEASALGLGFKTSF